MALLLRREVGCGAAAAIGRGGVDTSVEKRFDNLGILKGAEGERRNAEMEQGAAIGVSPLEHTRRGA